MTVSAPAVVKIIELNDGKLVGKTRFHKSVYFLEELNVGFGFDFEYYHYGPYSRDLSLSMTDADALGLLSVDWESTQAGAKYAIFKTDKKVETTKNDDLRRQILSILNKFNSVILELAATADFLSKSEFEKNFWEEAARRKPEKASPKRIKEGKKLLVELQNIN